MGTLGVEPIPNLLDARAAAGTGAALASDVGHRARSVVDRGIDIAIGGGMAQADEHRVDIDNGIQFQVRQGLLGDRPGSRLTPRDT